MLPYSEGIIKPFNFPFVPSINIHPSRSRYFSNYEFSTPNYYQNILYQCNYIPTIAPPPSQHFTLNSILPSSSNINENHILYSQNTPSISLSKENIKSKTTNNNNPAQKNFQQNLSITLPKNEYSEIDNQKKSVGKKVIQRKLFASQFFSDRDQRGKQEGNEKKEINEIKQNEVKEESKIKIFNNLKVNLKLSLEYFNLNNNSINDTKESISASKVKKKPIIALIPCCEEYFSNDENEIHKPYHTKIMSKSEFNWPKIERKQEICSRKLKNINLEIENGNKLVKNENIQNVFPVIVESNSGESKIEESSNSNYSIDQVSPFNFSKAVTKVEAKFAKVSRIKSDLKMNTQDNPKKLSDSILDRKIQKNSPHQDLIKLGEI